MKVLHHVLCALKNSPLTFPLSNKRKRFCFSRCLVLRSLRYFSSINGGINIQEARTSFHILPTWNATLAEGKRILQENHGLPKTTNHFSSVLPVENVIRRLQSTEDSNEYLINTFRRLLHDSDDLLQWPGLVTLLLSKAAGRPFGEYGVNNQNAKCDTWWESQMIVASVVNLLQKSITLQKEYERLGLCRKIHTGRRHSGFIQIVHRYFTSEILHKIGALNNCKAFWLISAVMESLAETSMGKYLYTSKVNCKVLHSLDDWESSAIYPQGILLANGCQAALELSGHGSTVQRMALDFARHLVLALKAHSDIHHFMQFQKSEISYFRLNALPVVLHVESNPELLAYIYSCGDVLDNLDHSVIYSAVVSGSSLTEANKILDLYIQETVKILKEFKCSPEKTNLIKLAESLKNTDCKSFSIVSQK